MINNIYTESNLGKVNSNPTILYNTTNKYYNGVLQYSVLCSTVEEITDST